jgi:hypothetical protein
MNLAPKGCAVVSLETLRELFADPKTNFGGTLHYRWVMNGRVLREFRSTGMAHVTYPVDLSWLIAEVTGHPKPIDLRLEVTQEPSR